MATRKVLINRHTSGSTAPKPAEMYLGEIAVAHETGKETLFTKNNAGDMVPFISCAQTISIVSGMIESVDVVYNVVKKTGEPYINVETGGTDHQKVFTLSTSGVASETNLNALSSATVSNFQNMTNILSALTDVVVTGISGDDIINATLSDPSTGSSNTYTLTHKQALATDGFKKLTTDAYGHVTAAADVTTEDIQALGFKTSAQTGADLDALSASVVTNKTNIEALSAGTQHDIETLSGNVVEYVKVVSGNIETVINELSAGTKQLSADTHNKIESVYGSATTYADDAIAAAIDALDSNTATTDNRHYVTAITIENGEITSIGEGTDPKLSVESAGTGNVVSSIAVDDHKITYQTVSVATSEQINALSASVINLSAVTGEFSGATDAKFTELSGATKAISGYAHDEIAALSAGTIQLSADTKAAIEQLSAGTIMVSGYAHGEIAQLSGAVQANEADIDNLSAATLALSAVTLTGVSLNNTPLTVTDHVVSVPVADDKSDIAGATATGNVADAKAVKDYVEDVLSSSVDYKGATASAPTGTPSKGDLYIASGDFTIDGKNVETGDFIIYNGTGWDVIEKNLDGAITGNLTAGTVTLGDSTNSVESLANGTSGQVLTMVDNAVAWANLPKLASASTGEGNVVTDIAVNDHTITFAKNFTAATNADLEIVSGIVDTFSAATESKINALSAGTISLVAASAASVFSSAKTYTDEQIDEVYASAVSYTDSAITYAIEGLDSTGSVSTTGHYLTSVTITDGKITAVGEEEVPAATPVTTVAGTTGDTAAAVLSGIVTGGTDGHQLTLNMTNKVFSATTADSAITSQSAQTSVSANMAYELSSAATISSGQVRDLENVIKSIKVNSAITAESASTSVSATVATDAVHASAATKVDSALTMTDGANTQTYDGSAAKTLTFGTTGEAGLKSMSMTDAGVVDVDVIDCGEY